MSKKRSNARAPRSTYLVSGKPAQRSTYLVKVKAKTSAQLGTKRAKRRK